MNTSLLAAAYNECLTQHSLCVRVFYNGSADHTTIHTHTRARGKVSWRKVPQLYSESLSGHQQVEQVELRPAHRHSNDFIVIAVSRLIFSEIYNRHLSSLNEILKLTVSS